MFDTEVKKAVEVLTNGGIILSPTDTIWGIGCDATNEKAVAKIYKLKRRPETKSMIVLLSDTEDLSKYIKNVPPVAYDLVNNSKQPLTVVYSDAINLAPNTIAPDGSIAIRIVRKPFIAELIRQFGKPIVSSSANVYMHPAPLIYKNISVEITDSVDYIVDFERDIIDSTKPSTIIRLHNNNEFTILRE